MAFSYLPTDETPQGYDASDYMVLVYDIEWDTGGEEVAGLPREYAYPAMNKATGAHPEKIADALTDDFGWCVSDFNVAVYKKVAR